MDPAACTVRFTRGDRARLLRVRFRDAGGVPWNWAGVTALLDCRVGDDATPRVFALTDTASATGQILLLADGWLEAWLEPAASLAVPAGEYWFGLRITDSLGRPRTWAGGPCLVRPRTTVTP